PTPPARVKHAGLEPLPAFLSWLSVRRQKESPPSRHGNGPYCYLKNPGFEPCPMFDPAFPVVHPFPEQEGPPHAARHTVIPAGHGGRVPRTGFAILETVDQPLGPLLELRDQRKGTP